MRAPVTHAPARRTGGVVEDDEPVRPGRTQGAPQATGPATASELGRWRRHKSISAGVGVLESTRVFRGGMNTSKWQVEIEKDPGVSGVLRIAVDGFLFRLSGWQLDATQAAGRVIRCRNVRARDGKTRCSTS